MVPYKKQLEILLIRYFKECYPDFPRGRVIPSESPDFIITLKSKNNLGIELTRLNPLNAREPDEDEVSRNRSRDTIIANVRWLFEKTSDLKLFVKFLFDENQTIPEEREMVTAVHLANIIRKSAENKKPDSFFYESTELSSQIKGLKSMLIMHHPDLNIPVWERSNNLGISENVVDDIRETIKKKDEKLRLYQKQHLNYYWLIITTDKLMGIKSSDLPGKIMNHSFKSHFQQVFLFDLIKSDIYQLV